MDWHRYFTYNPETGDLIRKGRDPSSFTNRRMFNSWTTKFANKPCGGKRLKANGYPAAIYVRVENRFYCAHRIIWEMHHGVIPSGLLIDHRDGNPFDNRLDNLRVATRAENNRNRRLGIDSTTRIKGVSKSSHAFVAYLTVNNKRVHLGSYQTNGCAAVARAKAALRYHGKFARFT